MDIIGFLLLTGATIQLGIVIYGSFSRLKLDRQYREASLNRFEQLVQLEIDRNRSNNGSSAAWQGYRNFVVRDKTPHRLDHFVVLTSEILVNRAVKQ